MGTPNVRTPSRSASVTLASASLPFRADRFGRSARVRAGLQTALLSGMFRCPETTTEPGGSICTMTLPSSSGGKRTAKLCTELSKAITACWSPLINVIVLGLESGYRKANVTGAVRTGRCTTNVDASFGHTGSGEPTVWCTSPTPAESPRIINTAGTFFLNCETGVTRGGELYLTVPRRSWEHSARLSLSVFARRANQTSEMKPLAFFVSTNHQIGVV